MERREPVYAAVSTLGRGVLRALDVRVAVEGAEHVPRRGPVLLAATHISFPDFVVLGKAARPRGRYVRFLCRHDIWRAPVVRGAMDAMGHVPVDRTAPAAALLHARRLLERGDAVGVFPEAGVSVSFTVRPLMAGAAWLAAATGAPVLPVALWGSQRLWTPRVPVRPPRHQRVDVAIGSPMPRPPDGARESLEAWTRDLGVVLQRMLADLQALPHHQPGPRESPVWHPAHLGGAAPRVTDLPRDAGESWPRTAVPVSWAPGPAPGPVPPGT